mgnify:CR=1 FL=1
MTRSRLENTIVSIGKAAKPQGYTPQGRNRPRRPATAAELAAMALKGVDLRYDGSIFWAYAQIVRNERRAAWFARLADWQFAEAVYAAVKVDARCPEKFVVSEQYEDELPNGKTVWRDRWNGEDRAALLQTARENVLMWARV